MLKNPISLRLLKKVQIPLDFARDRERFDRLTAPSIVEWQRAQRKTRCFQSLQSPSRSCRHLSSATTVTKGSAKPARMVAMSRSMGIVLYFGSVEIGTMIVSPASTV